MSHGGARPNAGRQKGTPNKATAAKAAEVAASGQTPLDYMIEIMRDDAADAHRRDDMAKAAAPYVHNRLAAVEHAGKDGGPIEITSKRQRDAAVAAALRADG